MNRQIKFRLIKDGKVVGYEVHKAGRIFHTTDYNPAKRHGYTLKPTNILCTEKSMELFSDVNIYDYIYYIEHDSKDQYTGLNDKNGVEIYEGDIVRNDIKTRMPLKVVWGSGGYILTNSRVSYLIANAYLKSHELDNYRVIGNIHVNPELLEDNA
jgi:hypothetical protein